MEKQISELARDIHEATRRASKILVEETRAFVKANHRYHSKNDFDKAHPKTLAELEAEYLTEKGYTKQEWISVEDGLPETDYKNTLDYNVLVYIPKREGCKQSGMFLGKVCKVKGDDGKRNFWGIKTEPCEWTVWGWSYFEHPVVTHWMPLPPKPKMKGAE